MAIASSLIAAAGAIGGAALSSSASKNATKAQSKANDAALQYERERAATEKAEREKILAFQRQKWENWNTQRQAIIAKYRGGGASPGIQRGLLGGGATGAAPGAAPRMTLGALMDGPPQMAQSAAPAVDAQPPNAPVNEWSDWSRYGAQR